MKQHIVIVGPAWATMAVLQPMIKYLRGLGYSVTVVPYRGHYGDKTPLEGVTLENFEEDLRKHVCSIADPREDKKVILLGISMGAAIAHRFAKENSYLVKGIIMYGTPMISRIPVWRILLRILFSLTYLKAIITGKGAFSLKRRDAEDWLFSGVSVRDGLEETLSQPESAKAVQQMMRGGLKPDPKCCIPYAVLTCTGEQFHRNDDAYQFARQQGRCASQYSMFREVVGGHFDALHTPGYMHALKESLQHIDIYAIE